MVTDTNNLVWEVMDLMEHILLIKTGRKVSLSPTSLSYLVRVVVATCTTLLSTSPWFQIITGFISSSSYPKVASYVAL